MDDQTIRRLVTDYGKDSDQASQGSGKTSENYIKAVAEIKATREERKSNNDKK